ncbi:MAG: peptidoglycan recognition protein family protein [Gammaproteobacteria bacterium]
MTSHPPSSTFLVEEKGRLKFLFVAVRVLYWFIASLVAVVLGGCAGRHPEAARSAPAGQINLHQMVVPAGRYGRHIQFPLRARYITIHSTANRNVTAYQHASGMAQGVFRGRTKTWHFTVDDRVAIQSLPLNIQGEHADHDGPGNKTSIGIEICEFRSRARQAAAIDRAARLTAWLLRGQGIPLDHVVPHYHWLQRHFRGYQRTARASCSNAAGGARAGPLFSGALTAIADARGVVSWLCA